MALSLELRGFGGPTHSFAASVGLKTMDYAVIGALIVITSTTIRYCVIDKLGQIYRVNCVIINLKVWVPQLVRLKDTWKWPNF